MKLKILLIVNLLISFLCTNLTAQNYEYFTAFEGIQAAKAKADELKLNNPKLVMIRADGKPWDISFCYKGKALNWIYVFSYKNDMRISEISLSKNQGFYNVENIKDNSLDSHSLYVLPKLSNFESLPSNLINSDFEIELYNSRKRLVLPDSGLERIFLSALENIYGGVYDSVRYIWDIHEISWIDNQLPDKQPQWSSMTVNAESGEVIREIYYTDVIENNNIDNKYYFPNPVSDYINISQYTMQIQIYNLYGDKLLDSEFKEQIDVSRLSAGVYFLKLNNRFYKFVKI